MDQRFSFRRTRFLGLEDKGFPFSRSSFRIIAERRAWDSCLHFLLPKSSLEKAKKPIKDVNLINLLVLNDSNASVVLPRVFRNPDWDFLFVILLITGALCGFSFFVGFVISNYFKTSNSEKSSIVFGLGMNNNGTGLVLASLSLAAHPSVMLPIIFYNLVQHLVAGYVDRRLSENASDYDSK